MICLWTWQSAPMAHHTTATEAVDLRTKKDRQVHTARPTAPEAVDALIDTADGGDNAAIAQRRFVSYQERGRTALSDKRGGYRALLGVMDETLARTDRRGLAEARRRCKESAAIALCS